MIATVPSGMGINNYVLMCVKLFIFALCLTMGKRLVSVGGMTVPDEEFGIYLSKFNQKSLSTNLKFVNFKR